MFGPWNRTRFPVTKRTWRAAAHLGPRRMLAAAVVAGALALSACATLQTTVDYYWQSAQGQWDLLLRAKPIPEVIGSTHDVVLKTRLERVHEIREFASHELGLPANNSYRNYTDLGRQFVLWNVFATPELSLKPEQWCYPIAGCVNYRGYFREEEARAEAKRLRAQGHDVYVGGVPAYSTLGYFDDPVLSSFVRWPETEIARLIFHELAHQLLYVPGDSAFNESFAVAVEEAGVQRWLKAQHNAKLEDQFKRSQRSRVMFRELVREARARLANVYASKLSDADKRAAKLQAFATMRAEYEQVKAADPSMAGYENWFAQNPNNANIAAMGLYNDRVPAFLELLHEEHDSLPRFYARVREIAAQERNKREAILASLASRAPVPLEARIQPTPPALPIQVEATAPMAPGAPLAAAAPMIGGRP
jgi:predicted aminopeptidase